MMQLSGNQPWASKLDLAGKHGSNLHNYIKKCTLWLTFSKEHDIGCLSLDRFSLLYICL